jgi:hypothetical protein
MSDLVTRLSVLAEDDGDRYPAHVKKLAEAAASRIAALEARLAERVRVKPLEWRKGRAETPFGPYHVIEETNDDEPFWFVMFNGKAAAMCGTHDNEGSAIFAAQADYERRILSALEATAAPEQRELSAEDVATFDRALLRSGRKAEATPPAPMVTFPGCVVSLNGTKISMAFETDEDAQTVFRLIDHIIDSTASEVK